MTKTEITTVDDYIASQPAAVSPILELVRRTIRAALPGAGEVISYKIPAYTLPGSVVLNFAGWKHHYSLYPASTALVAAFRHELASYSVSKGHDPLSTLRARVRKADWAHREVPREGAAGREKSKGAWPNKH